MTGDTEEKTSWQVFRESDINASNFFDLMTMGALILTFYVTVLAPINSLRGKDVGLKGYLAAGIGILFWASCLAAANTL